MKEFKFVKVTDYLPPSYDKYGLTKEEAMDCNKEGGSFTLEGELWLGVKNGDEYGFKDNEVVKLFNGETTIKELMK